MQTKSSIVSVFILAATSAVFALPAASLAADPGQAVSSDWNKPKWLSDLSLSAKESYDDNVLLVSGNGMQPQSSWVSAASLKLGFNLVPLLADQSTIQTFSLVYQPDFVAYDKASSENYSAHRINTAIKGKDGDVSFSFDNAFLYNNGSKIAPTYALNQLAGTGANQNDKFRNNYAHSIARERRNQIQDRYTALLQFNAGNLFFRPISSMTYYDLLTDLHNTGAAPYKGYQDYVDRYDLNGGVDLGYKIAPNLALTLGYRYGYQYQQQFSLAINSDQHFSSGYYQRLLFGVEGKLTDSLNVKIAVGPDFRDYNGHTPINDFNTTRYYGEAAITAAVAPDQSLTFNYKQWLFVASTGLVPYVDTTYTLAYHWSVSKQLGVDFGAKMLEANYTIGNDVAGSAPSLRDDIDYGFSIGFTYAVTPHVNVSAAYNYDTGRNGLDNLPANLEASYREFDHNVVTFVAQYKF